MNNKYKTINIEEGMPLSSQAIKKLTFEIANAKARGYKAIKTIHGFGSSGTGGKIRLEARKYLESLVKKGVIRLFITGETFSVFDEKTRKAIEICPEIRLDRDLERHNNGVTIIIL